MKTKNINLLVVHLNGNDLVYYWPCEKLFRSKSSNAWAMKSRSTHAIRALWSDLDVKGQIHDRNGFFNFKHTFVFLSLFHLKIKNRLKIFEIVNWNRFDSVFDTIMNDIIDYSSVCENPNFWLRLGIKI